MKLRRQSKISFTPPYLYQCQPATLRWTGGTAPFTLSVEPNGKKAIESIRTIATGENAVSPLVWVVDIPADFTFNLVLSDATGARASDSTFVWNTTATECLSATTSASIGRGPTSSPFSPTASGGPDASSHTTNVGAIVGGVVGGVVFIIALILLFIWRSRKTRRARTGEKTPMDLTDMSAGSMIESEVEPYPATAQALSSTALLDQRVPSDGHQGSRSEATVSPQPQESPNQSEQFHSVAPFRLPGDNKAQRMSAGTLISEASTNHAGSLGASAVPPVGYTHQIGPLVRATEGAIDPPPLYGP